MLLGVRRRRRGAAALRGPCHRGPHRQGDRQLPDGRAALAHPLCGPALHAHRRSRRSAVRQLGGRIESGQPCRPRRGAGRPDAAAGHGAAPLGNFGQRRPLCGHPSRQRVGAASVGGSHVAAVLFGRHVGAACRVARGHHRGVGACVSQADRPYRAALGRDRPCMPHSKRGISRAAAAARAHRHAVSRARCTKRRPRAP